MRLNEGDKLSYEVVPGKPGKQNPPIRWERTGGS